VAGGASEADRVIAAHGGTASLRAAPPCVPVLLWLKDTHMPAFADPVAVFPAAVAAVNRDLLGMSAMHVFSVTSGLRS
jgi:hypothetical protein